MMASYLERPVFGACEEQMRADRVELADGDLDDQQQRQWGCHGLGALQEPGPTRARWPSSVTNTSRLCST